MPNERRASERVQLALDALVIEERCVEADRATLTDLSTEGAFLEMLCPVPPGKTVKLMLQDTGSRERFTVRAKVVHKSFAGIGVRFLELEAKAKAGVRRLVSGETAPAVSPRLALATY